MEKVGKVNRSHSSIYNRCLCGLLLGAGLFAIGCSGERPELSNTVSLPEPRHIDDTVSSSLRYQDFDHIIDYEENTLILRILKSGGVVVNTAYQLLPDEMVVPIGGYTVFCSWTEVYSDESTKKQLEIEHGLDFSGFPEFPSDICLIDNTITSQEFAGLHPKSQP